MMAAMQQMIQQTLQASLSSVATDMADIQEKLGKLAPSVAKLQEQVDEIMDDDIFVAREAKRKEQRTT